MGRKGLTLAGCTLAVVAWAAPAWSATALLVADINTTPPAGFFPGPGVAAVQSLGRGVLFLSTRQLWNSDGTLLGTQMVRDFCPNIEDCVAGSSQFLGTLGGRSLLLIDDQLWSSDGTAAGTQALGVTLLAPFLDPHTPIFGMSASALFFFSCASDACGLWKSDGTPAGTVPVAATLFPSDQGDLLPELTVVGSRIFFALETPQGQQLWTSDGTAAGTVALGAFPGFTNSQVSYNGLGAFFAAGSRLFFLAADSIHQEQLWASDGTAAGTLPVTAFTSLLPFGGIPTAKAIGAALYFVANDGVHGDQLYVSDGTATGTRAVTAFPTADAFGRAFALYLAGDFLAQAGGRLLFTATDGAHPFTLWSSGGTPATTVPLADCPAGCPRVVPGTRLTPVGERVVFGVPNAATGGGDAWASDGSGAGTLRLRVSCDGCGIPALLVPAFVALPGRALFLGAQGLRANIGVWITDGSVAGTRLLVPLQFWPAEELGGFTAVAAGDKTFLVDPGRDRFAEGQLWVSDGTPGGTAPLTIFGTEGASSYPESLLAFRGGVLFTACDGKDRSLWAFGVGGSGAPAAPQTLLRLEDCAGPIGPLRYALLNGLAYFIAPDLNLATGGQLWRTDGTAAGTSRLTAFTTPQGVTSLAAFQGKVFFAAEPVDEPPFSSYLWSSDGTAAGTAQVPGFPGLFDLGELTAFGSELYFTGTGSDGSNGLFLTDGTAAGTLQLTHWNYPAFYQSPELTLAGGIVYFRALEELWKTDGTVAGTEVLPSLVPGQVNVAAKVPTDLAPLGGALLFFGPTGNGSQRGLFRTDGTAAGTTLLATVAPPLSAVSGDSRIPASFAALGNRLFFAADDGVHGVELWGTDGTPAGTSLVSDIARGAASSDPTSLVAAGNLLFFSANDRAHGVELWQSDGTAAGTRLVQDIAPGLASSQPASLTPSGGQLYFSADDGIYGDELWAYPLSGAACQPSATAMCLLGSRFRVEANWHDFSNGSGAGQAVALTDDTGYFWFFDAGNVELVHKIVDGRGLNGHVWSFYGALSNVQYELTVTDSQTGAARRYVNPAGLLASVADTTAFGPQGAHAPGTVPGPAGVPATAEIATGRSAAAAASCRPGPARLCLLGGRFAVQATWRDPHGNTGIGKVVPVTGNTGYFWFFDVGDVEVMLKVLDGRTLNGKFWVIYGALSNVEYTLTVTDTETGVVRQYLNPAGRLASVADTSAF